MTLALTPLEVTWNSGAATSTAADGNSDAMDVADGYEKDLGVKVVQVGAATTGAVVVVKQSPDGTNWYTVTTIRVPKAAGTYTWTVLVPRTADDVRLDFTAQVGGTSSTLSAVLGKMTQI